MSTRITNGRPLSAAGNRTRSNSRSFTQNPASGTTRTATTISFTAPATVADSGTGLATFRVGQRISVRGSARNSRVWTVASVAAGSLTVVPTLVTTEGAGQPITLALED